jgi:exosortase
VIGRIRPPRLSRRVESGLPLLILGAAFAIAYGGVLARLVRHWAIDANYSHGFLIIPVALYLVWTRRGRLAAAASQPSFAGLILVAASLGALLAGVVGAELFVARLSVLGVLAGAVLFVYGWEHLAIVAFPLALLLLMIPVPAIVFNQVALPLQLLASRLGVGALSLAGVPVFREGNVIVLAHGTLEVAEACSGIRSLMSLVTLAIIYASFTDPRAGVRVALAMLAVPVAVLVNGLRVGVTGLLEERLGAQAAADGFFHAFSGSLMFLVAFGLLVGLHRLLVMAMTRWQRRTAPRPHAIARIEEAPKTSW